MSAHNEQSVSSTWRSRL